MKKFCFKFVLNFVFLKSDAEELSTHRAVLFKKCVEAGAQACARGDFQKAVRLYEDAIELDPTNHVLYSNRSAIYCKLGKFDLALIDAVKSYELKPSWNKVIFNNFFIFCVFLFDFFTFVFFHTFFAIGTNFLTYAFLKTSRKIFKVKMFNLFHVFKRFSLSILGRSVGRPSNSSFCYFCRI